MENRGKNRILKCGILVFILLVSSNWAVLRVRAEHESQTAGVSLGKEITRDIAVSNSRAVEGWVWDSNGWWYRYSNGTYPSNSWRRIEKKWYYFDSRGYWVDDNSCETGSIKGIDVSAWQETINWGLVKDYGIEFAFVRIGHGVRSLDTYYKQNMSGANNVGIPVGVYFYSTAQNENDAVLDAQFVIKNMEGYKVSYPVVIDLEDASQAHLSKTQIGRIAKVYCDEVKKAGYTPMIYCNENWYKNYIDISQIADVEKWIARYNVTYSESIKRGVWQCCSTGRVDGIRGNADINFAYKDYTDIVTPRTKPVSDYEYTYGQWICNQTGWWYNYSWGGFPSNRWELINGIYYWFGADGYMATGWRPINSKWYFFDESGAMQTGWLEIGKSKFYLEDSGATSIGWKRIEGKQYYFDANGYMQTGWRVVNGEWYYLDTSGVMQSGWLNLDGKRYYLNSSGVMQIGWQTIDGEKYYFENTGELSDRHEMGWSYVDGKWYYYDDQGRLATGWRIVSGKWYYLDGSGVMQTGWLELDRKWYYMNSSGVMQIGWQTIDGEKYYFENTGELSDRHEMGWSYVDGKWYYYDDHGRLATGWRIVSSKWYYLDGSGVMQTGWLGLDRKWYYMNSSGVMQTGWQAVEGKWYYLNSGGVMVTGWNVIGGVYYYFWGNGTMASDEWIDGYYVDSDGKWRV